jgi:HAD superfamily hydrolase (TIGR01549 family)
MKKKLKAILFDMGSTLIEFENSTWDVLGRLCAQRAYQFLKQEKLSLPGFDEFSNTLDEEFLKARDEVKDSLKEFRVETVVGNLFGTLKFESSDGLCGGFLDSFYQPIADQLTLIDGALDVLKFFRDGNVKIGLVSNTIFPMDYHLRELRRFGLFPYLDAYHFSSQVGVRKPHPEIYNTTLNELGAEASQAAFVGDRLLEDVGGAQEVGMKGILVLHERRDYSAPVTPDAKIDRLEELPRVVSSLYEN